MKTKIRFIYALLAVTFIGGLFAFIIINKINSNDSGVSYDFQFKSLKNNEAYKKQVSIETTDINGCVTKKEKDTLIVKSSYKDTTVVFSDAHGPYNDGYGKIIGYRNGREVWKRVAETDYFTPDNTCSPDGRLLYLYSAFPSADINTSKPIWKQQYLGYLDFENGKEQALVNDHDNGYIDPPLNWEKGKGHILVRKASSKMGTDIEYFLEESNSPWNGVWTSKDQTRFDGQSLRIGSTTEKQFTFVIDSWSGSHDGGYEGIAKITSSSTATYIDEDLFDERISGCTITFELDPEAGRISTVVGGNDKNNWCNQNGGVGVYTGGATYLKGSQKKDFPLLNFFDTDDKTTFPEFKKIIGSYEKAFEDKIQLVYVDDATSTGFSIRKYTAMIRGLGLSKMLVVVAKNNQIWAIVDDDSDYPKTSIVRYFTNVPEYKNKLPLFIKDWIDGLNIDEKGVKFMNR